MASKKIKKVETPIDRRETFVSIQKNFAEDGNAQEKLKTLYDLQQADTAIDKIVQLRGELPAEVSALEDATTSRTSSTATNRSPSIRSSSRTSPTAANTIPSPKRLRIRSFFARLPKRTSARPR